MPRAARLEDLELHGGSTCCADAELVARTAHAAATALLQAYEASRAARAKAGGETPRGMTTDKEQDLLRSMLVFASSGLDATVKQLVKDALPTLIAADEKAINSFQKFVARKLLSGTATSPVNADLLASALVSNFPKVRLLEEYIADLTDSSLQSVDSLFYIAAALGADPKDLGLLPPDDVRSIFMVRNKIIHELDINLNAPKRTRNLRTQATMLRDTNRLFKLTSRLITSVALRTSASKS